MEKPIKPGRITALACMLMLLVIVFVVALYKLQIVDGKAYYEENRNSVASSQTVAAARGSILDRYGRVLVSNTSCNNLVFNPDDLFEQDDPNGILLKLARTVVSCGDTYVDELPVTTAPPFEYTDMSETQRTQLKGFLKYAKLDEEATAVELLRSTTTTPRPICAPSPVCAIRSRRAISTSSTCRTMCSSRTRAWTSSRP